MSGLSGVLPRIKTRKKRRRRRPPTKGEVWSLIFFTWACFLIWLNAVSAVTAEDAVDLFASLFAVWLMVKVVRYRPNSSGRLWPGFPPGPSYWDDVKRVWRECIIGVEEDE